MLDQKGTESRRKRATATVPLSLLDDEQRHERAEHANFLVKQVIGNLQAVQTPSFVNNAGGSPGKQEERTITDVATAALAISAARGSASL